MNRLTYILSAKNQYSIQSPFLYDLHRNVIVPPLDSETLHRLGIRRNDRYSQLLYKLSDHYHAMPLEASPLPDLPAEVRADFLTCPDGDWIGVFGTPHLTSQAEKVWCGITNDTRITLSVDIFYAGIVFSSPKLTKRHWTLTNHF